MREDYLIALANLVNGSLLGYEDRSRVPEYEKTVDDYVDSLEEKNQKYKEVIDNIKYYLEDSANQMSEEASYTLMYFLKEVE